MGKSFILMLQFLTRLPINISVDVDRKNIGRGTVYFPFIGMLIGSISALTYYALSFINKDIASLGGVFAIIAVTGGLHVDGLSDTCDGFFSSRKRERILEIMKDSRVGTFGVIGIIFDIFSKYVIIKSMDVRLAVIAIILACGTGRLLSSLLFTFGKTARPGGMGDMFTGNNTKVFFLIGAIIFLVLGFFLLGVNFLIALLVSILFSILFMIYSYKVIGGLTGDVYGACCELGEIIFLLSILVVKIWI